MGYQSTPVTIIDGEAVVGFDQLKLSRSWALIDFQTQRSRET